MFTRKEIDALFLELRQKYYKSSEWEHLNRQAHLGIASVDSGRSVKDIDPRIIELIKKHQPAGDRKKNPVR
jgi:hypothetical protein